MLSAEQILQRAFGDQDVYVEEEKENILEEATDNTVTDLGENQ